MKKRRPPQIPDSEEWTVVYYKTGINFFEEESEDPPEDNLSLKYGLKGGNFDEYFCSDDNLTAFQKLEKYTGNLSAAVSKRNFRNFTCSWDRCRGQ